MNERIKELAEVASKDNGDGYPVTLEYSNRFAEKFAELIVRECIYTIQRKIVRNGNTPENIRSRQHIIDLGNKFGITFPMDYVGVEE